MVYIKMDSDISFVNRAYRGHGMRSTRSLFKFSITLAIIVFGLWFISRSGTDNPDTVNLGPVDQFAKNLANTALSVIGTTAHTAAKFKTSEVPKTGRCKGEIVDNEDQCRYRIIEMLEAGDTKSAAYNIWERVKQRDYAALLADKLWHQILKSVRNNRLLIKATVLETTADLISEQMVQGECRTQLKISLVEHWLRSAQRGHAEKLLKELEPDPSSEQHYCGRGSAPSVEIYKFAILGAEISNITRDLGQVETWGYSTSALIYLAGTDYEDVMNSLIELAMRNAEFISEKSALDIIADGVRSRDPDLAQRLVKRANRL